MPFGWPFGKKPKQDDDKDKDTTEVARANKEIEKRMNKEKQAAKKTVSLLLLGTGGCGKSTVFKQMQNMYDGAIPEEELIITASAVRRQVLEDVIDLCRVNIELQASEEECVLEDEKSCEIRDRFASLYGKSTEDLPLTMDIAEDIEILWKESAIRKTFDIRSKSHIMDNTPYFFDKVLEVADPDYKANFDDHVRVRYRTTGIVHATFSTSFQDQQWMIQVTDVGGQRNERKKWINVFAGVNAVIFVVSLNGYDKVLFEDNSQNCWDETFQLFGNVTSLKEFKLTDFIVFLNKADLFEDVIQQVPFSHYYKECPPDEEHNPTYVINYVQAELTQRFSLAADRPIEKSTSIFKDDTEFVESPRALHFHVTCATDQTQIETVLKVIQFEAVKNQLQKAAII